MYLHKCITGLQLRGENELSRAFLNAGRRLL